MAAEYLFMRHGESVANKSRTISNRPSDHYSLTDLGREQVNTFLNNLRNTDISPIYASPITRAKETADIIAGRFGAEVGVEDGLREPFCGEIERRSDDKAWEIHASQEAAWQAGNADFKIPGGESLNDLKDRFIPLITTLVSKHRNDAGTVVIVSHGSVLLNMLPLILSNIQNDFAHANPLRNCAYVRVADSEQGLYCIEWDRKLT